MSLTQSIEDLNRTKRWSKRKFSLPAATLVFLVFRLRLKYWSSGVSSLQLCAAATLSFLSLLVPVLLRLHNYITHFLRMNIYFLFFRIILIYTGYPFFHSPGSVPQEMHHGFIFQCWNSAFPIFPGTMRHMQGQSYQ